MARILKQDAARLLGDVPQEYSFYLHDGRTLRNVRDLEEALGNMSDETYGFHANTGKNDFASWVRDVIKDDKLARDLARAENRLQAVKKVTERETFLSGKLV